jgi:hypothetical protein
LKTGYKIGKKINVEKIKLREVRICIYFFSGVIAILNAKEKVKKL